jgi:hypothetical protein
LTIWEPVSFSRRTLLHGIIIIIIICMVKYVRSGFLWCRTVKCALLNQLHSADSFSRGL